MQIDYLNPKPKTQNPKPKTPSDAPTNDSRSLLRSWLVSFAPAATGTLDREDEEDGLMLSLLLLLLLLLLPMGCPPMSCIMRRSLALEGGVGGEALLHGGE